MIPLLSKTNDWFVYIQIETSEAAFQIFRFQERTYDAVLIKAKSVQGDFRTAEAALPILREYLQEAHALGHRIIIGLHSALFSSVQSAVTLRRENPRQLISEAELENLISSGLWKMFSRKQKEIARTMNTNESNVVCVDALIARVRIDGHRVVSPVGFAAHTVELTIFYSATLKAISEVLAPFLSGEQEVYCTEIGVSELLRLAHQHSEQSFLFIRVSEMNTYVYEAIGGELAYADTIVWGRSSLIHALTNELMISRDQALTFFMRAEAGLTSVYVRRRIEALLLEEISVLLNGIGARASIKKANVAYISTPFLLSSALFSEAAARKAGIAVPIIALSHNSHGEKTQNALPLSMKTFTSSISSLCANAWAAHRSFEQSDLQKIAKRRARWIRNTPTRS